MTDLATRAPRSFTWDDFVMLDEDDPRELIDGELVETKVNDFPHEHAVALLLYFLTAWARAGNGGMAIGSNYKVRISEKRGVMPDVQFFRRENRAALSQQSGLVAGRPDLVIEIISPSSRRYDRVTKLAWYAAINVPEYWIIDAEEKTLERLVLLADGHYRITDALGDADAVLRPDTFPGLVVPIADLWPPPASPQDRDDEPPPPSP